MQTLNNGLRSNLYYCGLPGKFRVQMRVLQYAQMDISADEYAEFYQGWNSAEKKLADQLVTEMTDQYGHKQPIVKRSKVGA